MKVHRLTCLLILFLGADAIACRCAERTLEEYFDAADEVIVASLGSYETLDGGSQRRILTFQLLADSFKSQGDTLPARSTVKYETGSNSAACGLSVDVNAVYILFASSDGETMSVNTCDGSRVHMPSQGGEARGFPDIPARFVMQQLNALAGLRLLQQQSQHNVENRLTGLLDIESFAHAGYAELRERPCPDSKLLARIESYEELASREASYESPAAIVYGRQNGWYKLRFASGKSGWLAPDFAGTFFPYEDLVVNRLNYLAGPWHGFLWPDAGAGLPRRIDGKKSEQPAEILESTWLAGSLWLKVRVLERSPCEGGDGKAIATGWVPAYRMDNAPLAWFYSRGC